MSESTMSLDQILSIHYSESAQIVDVDEPTAKLVVFTLDDQWFAFRGDRIKEVLADCPVYFLPGCPPSLEGVVNIRGDIESVVRLRLILGLPEAERKDETYILLGQTATMRSGIRVSRVEESLDVPHSAIQSPPATSPDHLRAIVVGIVQFGDHLIHLLDLDRIFDDYRAGLR